MFTAYLYTLLYLTLYTYLLYITRPKEKLDFGQFLSTISLLHISGGQFSHLSIPFQSRIPSQFLFGIGKRV